PRRLARSLRPRRSDAGRRPVHGNRGTGRRLHADRGALARGGIGMDAPLSEPGRRRCRGGDRGAAAVRAGGLRRGCRAPAWERGTRRGCRMSRQIFVNLPVRDLARSRAFLASLGFTFNPRFSDDKAACMVVAEGSIHVMLLVEAFFRTFTRKRVADAGEVTEVMICLPCVSRDEVDSLVARAVAAGGRAARAARDHGFMYEH